MSLFISYVFNFDKTEKRKKDMETCDLGTEEIENRAANIYLAFFSLTKT